MKLPQNSAPIPLPHGHFTLVDADDAEDVLRYRWCKGKHGYVSARVDGRRRYLHRWLMGELPGTVDHINCNKLDNRRCNLRRATQSQQCQNKLPTMDHGFIGISFVANRWVAQISKNRIYYYLGRYRSPVDAARAYDVKARELYGRHARVNFPSD